MQTVGSEGTGLYFGTTYSCNKLPGAKWYVGLGAFCNWWEKTTKYADLLEFQKNCEKYGIIFGENILTARSRTEFD
jgi:hypothetical protein